MLGVKTTTSLQTFTLPFICVNLQRIAGLLDAFWVAVAQEIDKVGGKVLNLKMLQIALLLMCQCSGVWCS